MHDTASSRRRRIVIVVGVALFVFAIGWLIRIDRAVVTERAYESLTIGDARDDVERVLGRRSGNTREEFARWLNNRTPIRGAGNDLLNGQRLNPNVEYWFQDSGIIILLFDEAGRIVDKEYLDIDVSTVRQGVYRFFERFGW